MNKKNPELSIIIITYNSEKYIENCINSILTQDQTSLNYEIVVIDNCSDDNTSNLIKSKFPEIRFFRNQSNLGFAKAVNQSLEYLSGEYILLINPDVILKNDFFVKLSKLFEIHNKFDILGVKLVDEKGKLQPSCWKRMNLLTLTAEMMLPYQLSIKLVTTSPTKLAEVENVSGACMLIRKEVFQSLTGFDENFFLYYEEIDFCMRAKAKGYKIFYSPELEAVHFGWHGSLTNREIFFANLYKSKLYFIKKHYNNIFYKISYFVVITGVILRLIVSFLCGLICFNKNLIRISQTLILVLIRLLKKNE